MSISFRIFSTCSRDANYNKKQKYDYVGIENSKKIDNPSSTCQIHIYLA